MWKTSAEAPVKTYKLVTITYGTVSATFLATRSLKALANVEKAEFPDAADAIYNDSYMYNILSGESTLEGAKKLQTRLSQLLLRSGFELQKWVSNSPELLKDFSASSYVLDKEFQDAPVKTLAWIKTEPHKLKTFVSNRVAEIQTLSKDCHWKHVSSANDPVDLISRGCNIDELLKNEMWFSGPDLQTDEYEDNQFLPNPSYIDELKCAFTCRNCGGGDRGRVAIYRPFGEFRRAKIVLSPVWCSKPTTGVPLVHATMNFVGLDLTTSDRWHQKTTTTEFLAKIAQLSEFKAEIDALKKGKGVSKTSKLKALDHFLDEYSLLRVGRRLSNADLPFEAKHQIIIPTIFVCLATKAIHLEAVTDLTTEAFIAALKRLCARRGHISTLMSDNATNFKGAGAELNRFVKLICNKNETLANYFASEAIHWKFIPPRSPNFGGLWEAGVKSFKHHLYRTLVNSKITFEEFETIIIQIEGILNSRPLVPLLDNINEYEVLLPGHFIIGRPISAIPEPAILDISDNRLSRWQYTTVYKLFRNAGKMIILIIYG
ncbi:integrase catalytic domain-containing protein [Trichonephila clavipes]|nr:integrase catalytic domain-containing protein [Trichonephila clavipes]